MIRAIQLFFMPVAAWQTIANAKPGILRTLFGFVAPLLAAVSLAEGYALTHWGKVRNEFGHTSVYPMDQVIQYELAQFVITLLMVFVAAKLVLWIAESFHLPTTFLACFTLAAYGLSPIFLARFLHCIPVVNGWLCVAAGVVGCIYVLYQGTGIVLEPMQTKGFGLYLICTVIFSLLGGLSQLIALAVLQGRISF